MLIEAKVMAIPIIDNVEYIIDEQGKRKSVVMPVETYEEMLKDIQDLVTVAERRDDVLISADEFKKSLKKDGLL